MLFRYGVLAGPAVPFVDSRALAVAEDLDQCTCVDDQRLLADKLVRDAVVVLVAAEIDAAVASDLQAGVALDLEVLCRQRCKHRPLKREEALFASEGDLLHPSPVVGLDMFRNRLVELADGMERMVAQRGVYVPVHRRHVAFHGGLILGMPGAGGDDGAAVVVGEVLHHLVDAGLVGVGLGHRRLEVVGDQYLGDTAHGLETLCDGEQEVLAVLGRDADGEDIVCRGHAGHEHLHLYLLASVDVDIRELAAGEVDHQPFSWGVQVPDDGAVASGTFGLRILPVVEPELCQAVSFRMFRPVLLPQEPQGDSLAPQLALDVRQHLPELVEPWVAVGGVAAVKPAPKLGILQLEKPLQALRERLGLVDVVVDGLLVHPENPRDGAVGDTVPVHD